MINRKGRNCNGMIGIEPVVKLLSDLVAIPSVNPCFDDGNGEKEIADFVAEYARKVGLEVHRQTVLEGRENVVVGILGSGDETILLETHMDTVTAKGMTIEPFKPEIKDGKLFGRGACDAKASLAAMLQALVEVANRGTPKCTVWLAAVVDEENGFNGAQKLLSSGLNAHYAIVGEPTSLNIVIAHKGTVRGKIVTKGISAHSSQPEKGSNAINHMAKVILALERYDAELRVRQHPLVGSPTLTVTMISGGSGANLVPEFCQITVDRRTLPNEDPMAAWDELKRFLQSQPDLLDLNFEFAEPDLVNWGMEVSADSLPAKRLIYACEKFGIAPQLLGVRYASDASVLMQGGIPSVLFGPGSIDQAHTSNEWVEIEQVVAAQKVFEALIEG